MKKYFMVIILLFLQFCIKETVSKKDAEKKAYLEKKFSQSRIDKFNKKVEEIKNELKNKKIEHCYKLQTKKPFN